MSQSHKVFSNKVVVVTGGASGIGEQIVRQLADHAKQIIILDRNQVAGHGIADELPKMVTFQEIDMKQQNEVKEALNLINEKWGSIDYFFNFAGSFMAGEIRDTPTNDWHSIFQSNIGPIINGTSVAYELMQKNGSGTIINMASAAGLFPVPVMNIYGATKSAIVNLTLGLRMEAKELNIRVSVVCPTVVKTPLYDTAQYEGLDKEKALGYLKHRLNAQTAELAAERIIKG